MLCLAFADSIPALSLSHTHTRFVLARAIEDLRCVAHLDVASAVHSAVLVDDSSTDACGADIKRQHVLEIGGGGHCVEETGLSTRVENKRNELLKSGIQKINK